MMLARLPPGRRFRVVEMPELTGVLIHCGPGSALVELDNQKPKVRDFETGDGQWVRIEGTGRRRTTITRALEVRPL